MFFVYKKMKTAVNKILATGQLILESFVKIDYNTVLLRLFLLSSILGIAKAFESGEDKKSICLDEDNPIKLLQLQICPAYPHLIPSILTNISMAFATILENFHVDSNWPLEYVRVFVFGERHDNLDHERWQRETIRQLANNTDSQQLVLLEGYPLTFTQLCKTMIAGESYVWDEKEYVFTESLYYGEHVICQGWEPDAQLPESLINFSALRNEYHDIYRKFHDMLMTEYSEYRRKVKEIDSQIQITIPEKEITNEMVIETNELTNRVDSVLEYMEGHMDTIYYRSHRYIDEKAIVKRNVGIINASSTFFKRYPHQSQLYIIAGKRHLIRGESEEDVLHYNEAQTDLRKHFNSLEAQGIPTAILIPRR